MKHAAGSKQTRLCRREGKQAARGTRSCRGKGVAESLPKLIQLLGRRCRNSGTASTGRAATAEQPSAMDPGCRQRSQKAARGARVPERQTSQSSTEGRAPRPRGPEDVDLRLHKRGRHPSEMEVEQTHLRRAQACTTSTSKETLTGRRSASGQGAVNTVTPRPNSALYVPEPQNAQCVCPTAAKETPRPATVRTRWRERPHTTWHGNITYRCSGNPATASPKVTGTN